MKRFNGFILKEFHHIFRDKRTLLILFGMPIVQMMLFGYVISNEIRDVRIAVLDHAKDNTTRRIIDKLTSTGYFIVEQNLQNEDDIEKAMRSGDIKEVVIFEPEFGQKLEREGNAAVHVITDASEANTASMMYNYTASIIQDFINKENRNVSQPMRINVETRMMYNESNQSVYMFVPGTMAMILMLISALLTSISIVREKEMGTMEILLASPLKPIQIVVGKVTPYVLLSLVNAISIIALGHFVFGLPIAGSLLLLMGECILFIMMSLSLGILISTATNSQQIAMIISMLALMLPTILLSGFIYPVENMPKILQWLSYIVPPRYFIIIIKNVMLKGTDFTFVWKETLVLAGATIFFLLASARRFKIRLD